MDNQSERKGTIVETVTEGNTVYELREDEGYFKLYTVGEHGYFCGYVSDPEYLEDAIYNHEEEMGFMLAQAREEFAEAVAIYEATNG
jgi:hypothetical protein